MIPRFTLITKLKFNHHAFISSLIIVVSLEISSCLGLNFSIFDGSDLSISSSEAIFLILLFADLPLETCSSFNLRFLAFLLFLSPLPFEFLNIKKMYLLEPV